MSDTASSHTFYDHFANDRPTGIGMRLVRIVSRRIFAFAEIQAGERVLEIGPGRGVFADVCLRRGLDYTAIEPNEKMAELLERRGVRVIRTTVPPLPRTGGTFDVVVMNSVLEHMDSMNMALQLAREVLTLLNAGGRFVIYVPDYANWGYHFFHGDFSHSYVTSWPRIEGLLISAGFEDIRGSYLAGPVGWPLCFPVSGLASWLPFGLLDMFLPNHKWLHKLYKLQVSLLRRVLMTGRKPGGDTPGV